MMKGMTKVRRTISIDADLAKQADREADGNLSAFVEEAIEKNLRSHHFRRAMELFDEEYGPSTPEDVAKAEEWYRLIFGDE